MQKRVEHFVPIGKPPPVEKLPAVPVDNVVEYVRKGMKFPFRVEEGKRCDLGMFLDPRANPRSREIFPVGSMPHHSRSALVARVVFEDAEGRRWRDLNIKGMGASEERKGKRAVVPPGVRFVGDAPYGLCDWGYAETDRVKSEYFLKLGLRTHLVPFIARLKEIIVARGEKITITEARKRGIIKRDENGERVIPVLQARAYRTWARLQNSDDKAQIADAMRLVAQELGISPNKFGPAEYLKWFARTLGKQVAILHSSNHTHGYLTAHNITLACEITDLDSVGRFQSRIPAWNSIAIDIYNGVARSKELEKSLQTSFFGLPSELNLQKIFLESYLENLSEEGSRFLREGRIRREFIRHGVNPYSVNP